MIRIILPHHLQTLSRCGREVQVAVDGPVTQQSVLDALEAAYPMLRGTVREHGSLKRRPRVRFFVDGKDASHDDPGRELPASVRDGREPFRIVGAVAGG
jgi:hypothetical protein